MYLLNYHILDGVNFEKRHKFYKESLKELKSKVNFENNSKIELSYNECKKNNFPHISVTTKGDWFMLSISFDECDYKLNKTVHANVTKDFDNSIGFIEGYKTAIHPTKDKIPKFSTVLGEIWINYPPTHKKYYSNIIKKVLCYCFAPNCHTERYPKKNIQVIDSCLR